MFAQETRLRGDLVRGEAPTDRFLQQARAAGWRACLSPAYATGRGGHGGGVALLWPPSFAFDPLGSVVPGRAVAALWHSRRLGDVVLLSLYGVAGGGWPVI